MQACNLNEKARAFRGTGQSSTTDLSTKSGCAIAPFKFRKCGIFKERTSVGGHNIDGGQQGTIQRGVNARFASRHSDRHQKPVSLLDIIIDHNIGQTGRLRDRVAIFQHTGKMHDQCLRGIAITFLDGITGTGTTGQIGKEGAKSASFIRFDYDRKSLLHGIFLNHFFGRVSGSFEPDTTLFLYAPNGTDFQILLRMRDRDASRLGRVAELVMASCRLNFEPSVRLNPFDNLSALHQPSVVDALYIHTIAHHLNMKVCVYVYYFHLTAFRNRRMFQPIGGNNPPWGSRNPLKTVSRHDSCGCFCARIPGASRLWREGGEIRPSGTNKPACLLTGFYPPATSAVVESRTGGLFNSHQEGFNMTDKLISFDQIETTEQAAMLLNQLYDGLEGIALLLEAGHKEQAASIARMGMTACLMVTPPLEETIADLDEQIDTSPRLPIAWPEQGE